MGITHTVVYKLVDWNPANTILSTKLKIKGSSQQETSSQKQLFVPIQADTTSNVNSTIFPSEKINTANCTAVIQEFPIFQIMP